MMQMGGDFANNPAAEQFIDKMVSKHGFDRQQLHEILSQAKRLDYVLRLMDRQAPTAQAERAKRRVAALSQTVYYPGQRAKRRGVLESV
jgi:membrane-bound lytic murein transglycosylase B